MSPPQERSSPAKATVEVTFTAENDRNYVELAGVDVADRDPDDQPLEVRTKFRARRVASRHRLRRRRRDLRGTQDRPRAGPVRRAGRFRLLRGDNTFSFRPVIAEMVPRPSGWPRRRGRRRRRASVARGSGRIRQDSKSPTRQRCRARWISRSPRRWMAARRTRRSRWRCIPRVWTFLPLRTQIRPTYFARRRHRYFRRDVRGLGERRGRWRSQDETVHVRHHGRGNAPARLDRDPGGVERGGRAGDSIPARDDTPAEWRQIVLETTAYFPPCIAWTCRRATPSRWRAAASPPNSRRGTRERYACRSSRDRWVISRIRRLAVKAEPRLARADDRVRRRGIRRGCRLRRPRGGRRRCDSVRRWTSPSRRGALRGVHHVERV